MRRRTRRRVLGWTLAGGVLLAPPVLGAAHRHPVEGIAAGVAMGLGSLAGAVRRPVVRRFTAPAELHRMPPTDFEHYVADVCRRSGCTDVRQVGGAGDLGADVTGRLPDGRRFVIQCKRYAPTHKVGSPDLQRFGGTCWSEHRADVAALVTTSAFTEAASGYAVRNGIRTVDGATLARWAAGEAFPLL